MKAKLKAIYKELKGGEKKPQTKSAPQKKTEMKTDSQEKKAASEKQNTVTKVAKKREVKEYEGFLYEILEDEETKAKYVRITGINDKRETMVIPGVIDKLPVEVIRKGAFKNNKTLKEVIVPESVRTLGSEAFLGCKKLQKIELPPDLEVINASCFENCVELEEVIIPYSLQRIAKCAFKNCAKMAEPYHYVKKGIGATMTLDKSITETKLPSGLNYIGANAFEGCESLKHLYLPYKILEISEAAFKGCSNLQDVRLHNKVSSIGKDAFLACNSLEKIRMPQALESIDETSLPKTVELICDDATKEVLEAKGYTMFRGVGLTDEFLDSKMIPREGDSLTEAFYSEDALQSAIEFYETRTPVDTVDVESANRVNLGDPSRFSLVEDVYTSVNDNKMNRAKVMMTGDLMARPNQIKGALGENGQYSFDNAFDLVKDILADADLAIGNMEAMTSRSYAFSSTEPFNDDRVHLNAPEEFLTGVRNAGFDLVVNAQNHSYDTGTRGVFETLDALNRAQLIHTGLFTNNRESRFVLLNVNGIKIAVVSYFDQARQAMKRVNFTDEGLKDIFSTFEEEQIREDIAAARAQGAEFVIAYSHCGREYTDKITARQEKFAKMVANAGADYIFGCHSHCLQPYSMILTEDGRNVPVLYSGGNFLSDIGINMPYTKDTLVAELNLYRDDEGKVQIESEGYHPCLIRELGGAPGVQRILPINRWLKNCNLETKIALEEALLRIRTTLGSSERFKCIVDIDADFEKVLNHSTNVDNVNYEVQPITIAERKQTTGTVSGEYVLHEDGIYKRENDDAEREACLICAGYMGYDKNLEADANCFGDYEFLKSFRTVANCFKDTDFVVGNLATMASDSYPSVSEITTEQQKATGYTNCRVEYIRALAKAGFKGLAVANHGNASLGIQGLLDTEKTIQENHLVCSGIGHQKNPIVEINGIKVAVVSITANCINASNTLTDEAIAKFTNVFDEVRTKAILDEVKAAGAEFVLTYINCGDTNTRMNLARRRAIAEKVAEMGADYIICTVPKIVSKYYRYETEDGRVVPIASSLGSFISGENRDGSYLTAILKLFIRRNFDGKIDFNDNYIPIKVFKEHQGVQNAVMPAQQFFNDRYSFAEYNTVKPTLATKLGNEIKENTERIVRINRGYTENLTIKEVYEALGVTPSAEEIERLGDLYEKYVSCVAARKPNLLEGCVAVLHKHEGNYQANEVRIDMKTCLEKGVALVVDNVPHKELPCIVVDYSLTEALERLVAAVRCKYTPNTVAITGSMGKTTTKELMAKAFESHYKTLHISGNFNTIYTIGNVIQKLDADDGAYIQEVHGGSFNAGSRSSKMIKPNICVITNIEKNHITQVGSLENLIKCKMEIIDGLQEGGVLIINHDNKNLKNLEPPVRTIRYSTSDSSCHYYAQNIRIEGEATYFDIVSQESEFDHYGVYPAKLNIQGEHNIGNALAAFAAGRQAGIPPYKIIAGMSRYRTEGIRQNVTECGGIKMILDVNNSNPIALMAMMEVFDQLTPEDGGRKIAVLGMMGEQGPESKQIHYDVGKQISDYDFDVLFCFGEDAKYMVKGAKECGKEAYYFKERKIFNKVLSENIKPGDVVLFKGSHSMALEKETILPIFGNLEGKL